MRNSTRTRIAALAITIALPLAVSPAAAAETTPLSMKETISDIDEQSIARYFAEIDSADTEQEAYSALVNFLGKDAADRAIAENSAPLHSPSLRSAGTFLTCVKGKASDDIKSVFDINVVAVAIGQKDYLKAAKEAVKHLAKQGIKRNAATMAGMFAYWGWKCRDKW